MITEPASTGTQARKQDAGWWPWRKGRSVRLQSLVRVVEQIGDAVMVCDASGRIAYINPAFEKLTGYPPQEAVGQRASILKSGYHDRDFYRELWATILRGDVFRGLFVNRRRSGELYYEEKAISPIRGSGGEITHFVSTGKDVTERMQVQQRLDYLANHDTLTGLPNRTLFMDRLEQALIRATRQRGGLALLCLDIDRFKSVNDTYGHAAGDELLEALSGRISHCVRSEDTVARFGGDEFAIILAQVRDRDDVETVTGKILSASMAPFTIGGKPLKTSVSVGIALAPEHSTDAATLLRYADLAMYRAKADGRNTYRFFAPSLAERKEAPRSRAARLREALEGGELRLAYQSRFEVGDHRLVAVEASLRWDDPENGEQSPEGFMSTLGDLALLARVDDWTLHTACADAARWLAEGLAPVRVAVRLFGTQLRRPRLADSVRAVLRQAGLPAECLEIQVTERMLMENIAATEGAIGDLAAMGVSIVIDGFGSGFSALAYLPRFPVRALKIDRAFVADIGRRNHVETVIRAITALAGALDLRLIADGVTTHEQLDFLCGEGCDLVQGPLFSAPVGADGVHRQLAHETERNTERSPQAPA